MPHRSTTHVAAMSSAVVTGSVGYIASVVHYITVSNISAIFSVLSVFIGFSALAYGKIRQTRRQDHIEQTEARRTEDDILLEANTRLLAEVERLSGIVIELNRRLIDAPRDYRCPISLALSEQLRRSNQEITLRERKCHDEQSDS